MPYCHTPSAHPWGRLPDVTMSSARGCSGQTIRPVPIPLAQPDWLELGSIPPMPRPAAPLSRSEPVTKRRDGHSTYSTSLIGHLPRSGVGIDGMDLAGAVHWVGHRRLEAAIISTMGAAVRLGDVFMGDLVAAGPR